MRRRDNEILDLAIDAHATNQQAMRASALGDELGARRAMKRTNETIRAICLLIEGESRAA